MTDLSVVALMAAVAAGWRQIQEFAARLRGCFVVRTVVAGDIAILVRNYLLVTHKTWHTGDSLLMTELAYVKQYSRYALVAVRALPPSPVIVRRGKWLMWAAAAEAGPSAAAGAPQPPKLCLSTFRGTVDVDVLIKDAIEWGMLTEQEPGKRYKLLQAYGTPGALSDAQLVHVGGAMLTTTVAQGTPYAHWKASDLGQPPEVESVNAFMPCAAGEVMLQECRQWLSMQHWYASRGVPWRRGYLLHGRPGAGKTALVRHIAQVLDLPLVSFDLASFSNKSFAAAWRLSKHQQPCIALVEDIDCVFDGRRNLTAADNQIEASLTFDGLLNVIGGVEAADGMLLIITTNYVERVDEALRAGRPGRIDAEIHLGAADVKQRTHIIQHILKGIEPEDMTSALKETQDCTTAQVTEWAVNRAMRAAWGPNLTAAQPHEKV